MKKDTMRGIVGLGVLLILYILIAFLIPFVHTAVFWVSFVFTLVAFAVVSAALYIAFGKHPGAKSKFYGFPIARIGVIYGIVQLVAGLILMGIGLWVPVWVAVLIYAIALGVAAIGLISADAVREEIQRQDVKLKKDVSFMRNLQSKVCQMATQCDVSELKKFAEDIRYSDPVSSDAIGDIEQELAAAVEELQAAVVDSDSESIAQLCRKASAVLSERNRLCKLNKQ